MITARLRHRLLGRTPAGFTLVELIIVIAISGIIAVILGTVIRAPMQGFDNQVRRADLVEIGESALRRMQRDIRAGLPNSVRLSLAGVSTGDANCPAGSNTVCAIEILHVVDGGRYRTGSPGDVLQFNGTDTQFEIIGTLQNAAAITPATSFWVVINNQTAVSTQSNFNAYYCPAAGASHNCAKMSAFAPPLVTLAAAFSPTTPTINSPRQRFFVVDTPVTYRCDTTTGTLGGTLTRYSGYAIQTAQPTSATTAPLSAATSKGRVASSIVACRFTYNSGSSARAGLVTMELTVQDSTSGEQVRLLHQVHIYNIP